ncbi:hypothetical protein H4582DRAFT_2010144 [Lactarius indigo]|nr:hypothetical protein H4582DRAFT_2010144 [Lactarius indigo]
MEEGDVKHQEKSRMREESILRKERRATQTTSRVPLLLRPDLEKSSKSHRDEGENEGNRPYIPSANPRPLYTRSVPKVEQIAIFPSRKLRGREYKWGKVNGMSKVERESMGENTRRTREGTSHRESRGVGEQGCVAERRGQGYRRRALRVQKKRIEK